MSKRLIELGMHFDPAGGGADRYFSGLLQGFDSIGEPYLAAAFGTPSGAGISLGPQALGLRQRWAAIKKFGRSEITPDSAVATHFALYAHPLVRQLKQARHVVHFHGPWADESAREKQKPWVVAAKRFIEKRVYRSARRLIVLSSAFRDILIESYGIAPDKIVVVPGGVDIERFRLPKSRLECREKLGWPTDKKIIFCVRRLVRRMGIETLLAAFARVAEEEPDAVLVIAGRGPLAEELREQSERLGLADRVIMAGFVSDTDLPVAYGAADFSIVPSQALEGFGLVTLESLACGTPALVTPVGGLPEAVGDLDLSLILSGSDEDSLIAGLRRGLSQPLPTSEMCHAYAKNNFAWPVIARRVADVYDSLR